MEQQNYGMAKLLLTLRLEVIHDWITRKMSKSRELGRVALSGV